MEPQPPSGGGEPPDQSQMTRLSIPHKTHLVSTNYSTPAAAAVKNGEGSTVAQNHLESSTIISGNSAPNRVIPSHELSPTIQMLHTDTNMDHFAVENHIRQNLQSADEHQLVGNGVPVVQEFQTQYQSLQQDEDAMNTNPIQHGYQPIMPILDSRTIAV